MFYEDYEVGQTYDVPEVILHENDIIEFAKKYDARSFHTDKNEAKKSYFGTLIASGLHTMVACWGAWVATGKDAAGMICGLELTNNKWLKPVYPDDVLKGKLTITKKTKRKDSSSGAVSNRLEVKNQRGELVLTLETTALIKCRTRND